MGKYFRAYATSRPFGDFTMPVPAQNSCMREYVSRRNGIYIPPQLEHKFDNCFMQLFGTLAASEKNDTVLMYSFEIIYSGITKLFLPLQNHLKKGGLLGFVLENTIINSEQELEDIINSRSVRALIMKDDILVSLYKNALKNNL